MKREMIAQNCNESKISGALAASALGALAVGPWPNRMALADSSCSEHQSDQNSRLPHKTRLRGLRCFRQMPLLHEALRYMFESCNSARKTKRKSCPVRSLQHLHHAPARLNLFPCEKLRLICGNQLTAAKVDGSYSVIMPFLQALPYMLSFAR